jgi:hypothetical protein
MGISQIYNLSLKGSGLGVHLNMPDQEPAPRPTVEELTAARADALASCSTATGMSPEVCEAAIEAGQGCPECPEPDVLKAIIDLIDADAQLNDAVGALGDAGAAE